MNQSKDLISTLSASNGTVEIAPVRPAYVINAETIKQCKVGKSESETTPYQKTTQFITNMPKYFLSLVIVLLTVLITSCGNEYDKHLDEYEKLVTEGIPHPSTRDILQVANELNKLSDEQKSRFEALNKIDDKHFAKQLTIDSIEKNDGSEDAQKLEEELNSLLTNLEFKYNSDELTSSSYSNLNQAANLLKKYSKSKIEIGGHTSNDPGDIAVENLILSAKRAKAVYEYLINKEIEESRLTFIGYGHAVPIADNSTKKGREKNRRVEFRVVDQLKPSTVIEDLYTSYNESISSKNSSSDNNFDQALKSYENFIDQYIVLLKKAKKGDMSALAEYQEYLEKANEMGQKFSNSKGNLTPTQLEKFTKLQMKLMNATSNNL